MTRCCVAMCGLLEGRARKGAVGVVGRGRVRRGCTVLRDMLKEGAEVLLTVCCVWGKRMFGGGRRGCRVEPCAVLSGR